MEAWKKEDVKNVGSIPQRLAELHIRKLIHSLTGDSILLVISPGSGLLLINAAPEFHLRSEMAAEQSNR